MATVVIAGREAAIVRAIEKHKLPRRESREELEERAAYLEKYVELMEEYAGRIMRAAVEARRQFGQTGD